MNLTQLPSGRWRVAVKMEGERRTGTADTKNEARRLGAELMLRMGGGPDERVAVGDLVAVMITGREQTWSPTYRDEVLRAVDCLPDEFTDRPAVGVGPVAVEALYRQLLGDGWSPSRVRRVHEVLSTAFANGRRLQLVPSNPFEVVPKPEARRRTLTIPTHDDVAAILTATRNDTERLALRLSATLGARRGEVVALTWDDVDTDRAEIVVRRSLVFTPTSGVVERDTKTGDRGHRVVPLDLPTVTALRRHRAAQLELAMAAGIVARHVFSDDAGVTPWLPNRLTHVFIAARRAAGVDGVRLHDLRHYVATTMLQDGEALLDVAHQLGHSTATTTATRYAHYLPGRGRESVNRRAARLDANG